MTEVLVLPTTDEAVTLRELATDADDAAYFESYNHSRPEILVFDPDAANKHLTVEDTTATRLEAGDKTRMGIWRGDTFVGSVNLHDGEIGYWVDTRHTGNGYATLAATALSRYAAANYHRVYAEVVDGNEASAHVLENSGFEQTARSAGRLVFELHEAKIPGRKDVDGLFQFLQANVANVPELEALRAVDPDHAYAVYRQYAQVVESLADLDGVQLQQIATAYREMGRSTASLGSASKTNATDILGRVDATGRNELAYLGMEATEQDSAQATAARADLLAKLEGGHRYKVSGRTPVDGDPEADTIIWGHTQITSSEALLHFTISHYLERFAVQFFAAKGVEFDTEKDHFLNAMTDVLTLDHLADNRFAALFAIWAQPRAEGGLGWIKDNRTEAFAAAVAA